MLKSSKLQYSILRNYCSTCQDLLLGQCLKQRTLLQLSGNDAKLYLQGLITNDMSHLQGVSSSIFALFLNSRGRILYDSIIYNTKKENTYFIECDKDASPGLRNHLLMYKVRRKINVDFLEDELDIWTVVDNKNLSNPVTGFNYGTLLNSVAQNFIKSDMIVTTDPRLSCLGLRIITPKKFSLLMEIKEKINVKVQEKNFYNTLRYKLGIGEGLQELTFEKCFPLEANGDYLRGISFHKGCYIGQELTARTYHTGVIRKRFMPLIFQEEIKSFEHGIPIFPVPQTNKAVGKLQGAEQNFGIGVLKIEEALKADELTVLDTRCKTERPFWWPPIEKFK